MSIDEHDEKHVFSHHDIPKRDPPNCIDFTRVQSVCIARIIGGEARYSKRYPYLYNVLVTSYDIDIVVLLGS